MNAITSEGLPIARAPSSALPYPALFAFFLALVRLTLTLFKGYVLAHSSSPQNVRSLKTGTILASFPDVSRQMLVLLNE